MPQVWSRKEGRKDSILEPGLERKTDSWKEEQQKDAPPYEHFTALGKIVYYKFFLQVGIERTPSL